MKKMSPIFFSSVEKSNDGNHLKRVFPNSQANRSHPRRVNSRSKFGFFSCFFNFGFSAILWPPSVVRSWNFDSRRISSSRTSRNFFCRGRRWRKIENLRKTSRKILKKSRKTTKKTFHKNTNNFPDTIRLLVKSSILANSFLLWRHSRTHKYQTLTAARSLYVESTSWGTSLDQKTTSLFHTGLTSACTFRHSDWKTLCEMLSSPALSGSNNLIESRNTFLQEYFPPKA